MPTEEFTKLFIGGEWVAPEAGGTRPSIDPSTGAPWGDVPWGSPQDVTAAVDAASDALAGPWQRTSPAARGKILRDAAAIIRRDQQRVAEAETRDNGKPINDTTREVRLAADWLDYYGGYADKVTGATLPFETGTEFAFTLREPFGVVGAITPWNAPFLMESWKVGAALAMGNTMVLKPSELTSVTALYLASALAEAGLPAGVLNVVTGDGRDTGAALVSDPRVRLVSFTGSIETATAVARLAADGLKRSILECGGKAPNIVFADADLKAAARSAARVAFKASGQSCSVGSRLFVQDSIYDEFLAMVRAEAATLRVANPMSRETDILGPQASSAQLEKTLSYIELGREEGRVLLGGDRPSGPEYGDGFYIEPTIVDQVSHESRLAQEEIFGPVLTAFRFTDEDEVIRLANQTRYGLVGAIWTGDVGRGLRFVKRMDAGFVTVNTYRPHSPVLPYGGRKMSGYGSENGYEALENYSQIKTAVIHHG